MKKNMIGEVYADLTVVKATNRVGVSRSAIWICKCSCGELKETTRKLLINNKVTRCDSCVATNGSRRKTHGDSKDTLYSRWRSIKARTGNPNHESYHNYGGRGITMSVEFVDSFETFRDYVQSLVDFGVVGYELDRRDNDGSYVKGNLRWVSRSVNSQNRRERQRNAEGQYA